MCGILFCCCSETEHNQVDTDVLRAESKGNLKIIHKLLNDSVLEKRGPNVSKQHKLPLSPECLSGWMRGCVLHLRGQPTPQPLVDDLGNALLWNGEIFDGIEVSKYENDTQVLFNHLTKSESDDDVLKTLERVKGPWAVIFWQAKRNRLWFGRDVYGRRSLLWHLPKNPLDVTVLTSVAVGNLEYTEIPSVGVFALDFSNTVNSEGSLLQQTVLPVITLHPWHECRWPGTKQLVMETEQSNLPSFLTPNQQLSVIPITLDRKQTLKYWVPSISKILSFSSDDHATMSPDREQIVVDDEHSLVNCLDDIAKQNERLRLLSEELVSVLQDAVMKRVNCLPVEELLSDYSENLNISRAKVAVLFSGGLDSSVIAALLDRCLPPDESIDLLNVAFEQPPPRQNTTKTKHKRTRNMKKKSAAGSSDSSVDVEILKEIPKNDTGSPHRDEEPVESDTIASNYDVTCKRNSERHPSIPSNFPHDDSLLSTLQLNEPSPSSSSPSPSSSMLSPSSSTLESENVDYDPYDVPDRRTGRIAFSELNPNRKWNFIEINVSQKELQTLRSTCIGKLIYPLQTVLDDSIGCALWFAARGIGDSTAGNGKRHHDIVSKAKVILCGMAADEQFAGYSRHRVHFHQFGEESLINQLEQEIWRISARNLGRDDRIIADHGKEARFPFLDETFTEFVSKIPIYKRANLHLPRGLGEKLLLRLSALNLGLRQTACQPKRAIQFGSKIAKLDDSKEKGSDVCQRLL